MIQWNTHIKRIPVMHIIHFFVNFYVHNTCGTILNCLGNSNKYSAKTNGNEMSGYAKIAYCKLSQVIYTAQVIT